MTKVRRLSELSQSLPFTEYDFYDLYQKTFENSELGRMKKVLPLREMADAFGLVSKRQVPKRGPEPYFSPEGKVALVFLIETATEWQIDAIKECVSRLKEVEIDHLSGFIAEKQEMKRHWKLRLEAYAQGFKNELRRRGRLL